MARLPKAMARLPKAVETDSTGFPNSAGIGTARRVFV